jgi:hypothetical protein
MKTLENQHVNPLFFSSFTISLSLLNHLQISLSVASRTGQALPNKNYMNLSLLMHILSLQHPDVLFCQFFRPWEDRILYTYIYLGHYLRFIAVKSVSEFPSRTYASIGYHYTMDTNFPVRLQNQTGPCSTT